MPGIPTLEFQAHLCTLHACDIKEIFRIAGKKNLRHSKKYLTPPLKTKPTNHNLTQIENPSNQIITKNNQATPQNLCC